MDKSLESLMLIDLNPGLGGLGTDDARISTYIEALLVELNIRGDVSVFHSAVEISGWYGEGPLDGWLALFLVHTAPPDVRYRAMQRTLNDPAFRRTHLDDHVSASSSTAACDPLL